MCFSPEADLVVGAIVAGVGVDSLRHVRSPRQLPLAAIPLLLGLHQVTEAFVWWGLQGHVAHTVGRLALWAYLLFALVALPALLPVTILLVETSRARRAAMAGCTAAAVAVAAVLAVAVLRGPIGVAIEQHYLSYDIASLSHGGQLTAVYVMATCLALLVSSSRDLVVLGVLNLAAVPVLAWLTLNGFISLWCFWAAIVSIVIARHMRRAYASFTTAYQTRSATA